MGAVKTAGRGREVDDSADTIDQDVTYTSIDFDYAPPEVERTLTVGREAILEES